MNYDITKYPWRRPKHVHTKLSTMATMQYKLTSYEVRMLKRAIAYVQLRNSKRVKNIKKANYKIVTSHRRQYEY